MPSAAATGRSSLATVPAPSRLRMPMLPPSPSTMFRAMADRGINIQAISTSEIKISVLIDEDETELAVRVLHTAYGMDAADAA